MSVKQYKNDCLNIARIMSPYDTGNLAFNATTSFDLVNGFGIKISGIDAHYWVFIDRGTRYSRKWVGYVGNIASEIGNFIYDRGNSKFNNTTATSNALGKLAPSTQARQQRLLTSQLRASRETRGE